jgi:hypothetical protein
VKADLQLGFSAVSHYNAARHTMGIVTASPADDIALNHHALRSDSQSHHRTIGVLVNAKNQKG